jgi:outer membrane immunogenic protein
MFRILKIVGVLALVVLLNREAHAASNDVKLPSNWSGTFIGAFVAHSWVDLDYSEPDFPGFERNPSIDGFTGGALLGHNFQFGRIVLGVEADGGSGDIDEEADKNALNNYSAFDIDWNAHFRSKIGFAFDSTLLYVAGGLALAGVTVDDTDPGWGKDKATHAGWTVGAGIEQALTRHLRLRVEYLHDDYGKNDYTITGPLPYRANVDLTANTVRACLSFHF